MSSQTELEATMLRLGRQRVERDVAKAEANGRVTTTRGGMSLLQESLTAFEQGYAEYRDRRVASRGRPQTALTLLSGLPDAQVALLTARVILDGISRPRTFTSLSRVVGGVILEEINFRAYQKHDKQNTARVLRMGGRSTRKVGERLLDAAKRDAKFLVRAWTAKETIQVGALLVELFMGCTGLINIRMVKMRGKSSNKICASQKAVEWLEHAHDRVAAIAPVLLPCVSKPVDWHGIKGGGYHTPGPLQRPVFNSRHRAALREAEDADMPDFYSSLNALQAVAWQVNPEVYDVMTHVWGEGGNVADLPQRESVVDKVERPDDLDTNPASLKAFKLALGKAHGQDRVLMSQRIASARTMQVAHLFKDKAAFFFPYKADWRGRLYVIPSFLDPQGSDQARGLLRFAEYRRLGELGVKWLMVHGANCWGYDKCGFEDRIQWVRDNAPKILAVGEDPIANQWWASADRPWSFLAFCIEFWEASNMDAPEDYMSSLPIHMDGSSNGLQIFSLLLKDQACAESTNCTPHAAPADIYQDVADALTLALYGQAADMSIEPVVRECAQKWLQWFGGKVDRKFTKPVVMVVPYGGTLFAAKRKVEEWYQEQHTMLGKEDIWGVRMNPACGQLTTLMWEVLKKSVSGAYGCMDWMQKIAKICSKHDVPVTWTSPSGFRVRQSYTKSETTYVTSVLGDKVRRMSMNMDTDTLCKRRQRTGVAPNYVHSLDAACVHKTVVGLAERGITSMAMVHDSYAVHADRVDDMNEQLRDVYLEVFSENQLDIFRSEVQALLPPEAELPPVPSFGLLDVSCLKQATYFFA